MIRSTMLTVCLAAALLMTATAAAETIGWRTDGTGKYPDADPPTTWSTTENVVWKAPMPEWGNATPVLVGNRILLTAEPDTLLCLDKTSGQILWQNANPILDALPEEQAALMRQRLKEIDLDRISKAIKDAERQIGRTKREQRKKPDDEGLKQKIADLTAQVVELKKQLEPIEPVVLPNTHGTNGFASATPVTDGKHVWAVFGTGVVACYDLEGNRRWIRLVEKPRHGWGHSTSPVLAGGKLIVHIQSPMALDPATGKELWRSSAKPAWGSPAVADIGGKAVVLLPGGTWLLAEDGSKMAEKTVALDYNQPVLHDGIAYFIQNGGAAFRLPESTGQQPEKLWTTEPHRDRYYASPVVHDGLIYDITQRGILSAIDAATGEVVYQEKLSLGREQCYPSITLAGSLLYASGSDGITAVFRPGRTYEQVAMNKLEQFRANPVFEGKRMYVRTMKHLFCIGQ